VRFIPKFLPKPEDSVFENLYINHYLNIHILKKVKSYDKKTHHYNPVIDIVSIPNEVTGTKPGENHGEVLQYKWI
jgi:hypothetical protein